MSFFVRKAQSSLELVSILSILLFLILGSLGLVLYKTNQADIDDKAALANSIGNILLSEINLAKNVQGDYLREFYLPEKIDGVSYEVYLSSPNEIILKVDGIEHVTFLGENVTGSINVGRNIIRKSAGNIKLN